MHCRKQPRCCKANNTCLEMPGGDLTKLQADCTQRSPWEARSTSESRNFPLCNPNVHFRLHKSPPGSQCWATWNQPMPSHSISLRPILISSPSTPRSSQWSLSFRFHHQNRVCISILLYNMPCPSHHPWFYQSNNILWKVQIIKFLIRKSAPSTYFYLLLRPTHLPQYLFSNTISLSSSLQVRDQVSCPQKTRKNFSFVYLIYCCFRKKMGRENTPDWTVAGILQI